MTRMVFQMLATIGAVPLCVHYLEGVHAPDLQFSLIAGVILALVYLLLRPLVRLVTKVFSILTLGLLSIVIDAWLVQFCQMFMNNGFYVDSFWWAALVAIIVNVLRFLVGMFFKKK